MPKIPNKLQEIYEEAENYLYVSAEEKAFKKSKALSREFLEKIVDTASPDELGNKEFTVESSFDKKEPITVKKKIIYTNELSSNALEILSDYEGGKYYGLFVEVLPLIRYDILEKYLEGGELPEELVDLLYYQKESSRFSVKRDKK